MKSFKQYITEKKIIKNVKGWAERKFLNYNIINRLNDEISAIVNKHRTGTPHDILSEIVKLLGKKDKRYNRNKMFLIDKNGKQIKKLPHFQNEGSKYYLLAIEDKIIKKGKYKKLNKLVDNATLWFEWAYNHDKKINVGYDVIARILPT
jgi:hypothetical protein